jgi:hypothetical protein
MVITVIIVVIVAVVVVVSPCVEEGPGDVCVGHGAEGVTEEELRSWKSEKRRQRLGPDEVDVLME